MSIDSTNAFLPEPIYSSNKNGVKVARPDIILDDESLSIETMTDLLFEDIGGQEILNTSRSDLINSPYNIRYQPIKNLSKIAAQYNSQNMINFSGVASDVLNFPINLDKSIPQFLDPFISIDETTGDMIINLINIGKYDQVEVQLFGDVQRFDDTIY